MTMKRFGVQLAAGGLVILLGALGVAQAQRDTQPAESEEWDVQQPQTLATPVPIAALDDSPALLADEADESVAPPAFGQPAFQNAAFTYPAPDAAGDGFAASQNPIRQASHEDGFALPQWSNDAGTEPVEPSRDEADEEAAAGPASFALPPAASFGAPVPAPASQSQTPAPAAVADETAAEELQTLAPQYVSNADEDDFAAAPGSAVPAPRMDEPASGFIPPQSDFLTVAQPAAEEPAAQPHDAQPHDAQPHDAQPEDELAAMQPVASEPVNELRAAPAMAAVSQLGPSEDVAATGFEPVGPSAMVAAPAAFDRDALDRGAAAGPSAVTPPSLGSDAYQQPSTYNAPQYDAAPNAQQEPAAVTAQPAPAYAGADAYATPATGSSLRQGQPLQPLRSAEAFGQPQPSREVAAAAEFPAATNPAARVASAVPVPLAGIDEAAMETVLNEPGDRRLEGMQSPSIIIQKRAPDEVKVGKPATFAIQVQNVGGVEALGVQVYDRVPAGMRLIDASPQPQQHGDVLIWQLGALEPGGERMVSMQLVPEQEGELGSVARVTFEAAASVRTISTRPALKITQRAPQQVLIGQQLEIELEVSNPGTGAATGVIMQEDVPEGLEHPKGRQLDNLIGTLAPGEVRRQVLRLRAVSPGTVENHIRLVGDDGLAAEHRVSVEVIAPQLAIELEGPARRFLERQATYQINLANTGSAEATNVEIVAYLDRGFSFVGTEYQGQYDPNRHAVYWSLAELPPEGRGVVPLTLLPIEQGERAIRLEARGDLNLVSRHEKKVNVDALAELTFAITDDVDPIEIGGTVTYEVRITNRGSGDDGDVRFQMQLPSGLELISSDNDASTDGRGLVVFAPQSVMAARSETVHRIRARATAPGTHVVKAMIASRETPVQVTKEESTTVYADQ